MERTLNFVDKNHVVIVATTAALLGGCVGYACVPDAKPRIETQVNGLKLCRKVVEILARFTDRAPREFDAFVQAVKEFNQNSKVTSGLIEQSMNLKHALEREKVIVVPYIKSWVLLIIKERLAYESKVSRRK